ncbi:hypothetical protein CI109_101206 [Kwoniella shandongensis]|uniref:SWR1-complex protein 5 n=1 Tax=Kwoniella shandongensis TaxID=1734106 RepID=A0A5M6BTL2_9TREE|nr:uncharacterized protein CI109_005476 [Kwoniella shandongensis]KAA5526198.1 hypothetical protein CI109_005476 [Kwoniella shandongensis]
MSTLLTAHLSSDESDGDFVPDVPKSKSKPKTKKGTKRPRPRTNSGSQSPSATSSSSGSGSEDDDDGEVQRKKAKLEQERDEVEERRRKAREEYEKLKAEMAGESSSTTAAGATKEVEVEKVEIKRARRFAGETIYETAKLPASDPEVVAYLARQVESSTTKADESDPSTTNIVGAISEATPMTSAMVSNDPSSSTSNNVQPSSTTPTISAHPAPRPKGPPPRRKPRQSLEQMSAALDKGKKMTTLEKSAMDWKSHTSSSTNLSDELAANRRNGGYLEKQDFLDRVGERRAGAFGTGSGAGTGGGRR